MSPEQASAVLFGRIVGAGRDRLGVPGAELVLVDRQGAVLERHRSGADGRFVLRGSVVRRPDARLVAHHGGHGLSRFVALPRHRPGETGWLDLSLERELGVLHGVVAEEDGAPFARRDLLLRRLDEQSRDGASGDADILFPELPVRSGPDGSFRVLGLEPGDYELVLASAPEIRTRVSVDTETGFDWRLPSTRP